MNEADKIIVTDKSNQPFEKTKAFLYEEKNVGHDFIHHPIKKSEELMEEALESVKEVSSKALKTVKEVAEHPILSVERGYDAIKEKVKHSSEGI